jgi:hypothetical protein
MATEGRDLVTEAVNDAKRLKQAALESAKKELIEKMAPNVRALVEQSLREALADEGVNRTRRVKDGYPGETAGTFEEGKDKGDQPMDAANKDGQELDMESLAGFFPALSEMPGQEPLPGQDPLADGVGADGIPTLGEKEEMPAGDGEACDPEPKMEAKKKKGEDEKEEEDETMDETIEISEESLRKVYESALQLEVQVKKGFSEISPGGELADVVKEKGIADVKSGEHEWEKETPPAKQDFTVKEAKAIIARGLAENKALRTKLVEAVKLIKTLGGKLHEVNLFNAKVLHVNRLLNTHKLTKEQKEVVLESMDKATTLKEVTTIFETVDSSLRVNARLNESRNPRKPAANAQRARTSGAPSQEVLRESVDRASNGGDQFARMRQLAGIVK